MFLPEGLAAPAPAEPVSYTHLDVYKRQSETGEPIPANTLVTANITALTDEGLRGNLVSVS